MWQLEFAAGVLVLAGLASPVAAQGTTRVSVSSSGRQADSASFVAAISGDGRLVAFDSIADNLVLGDQNASTDVFVHDRRTRRTERVSVGWNGSEADSHSDVPTISADGRFVAFQSTADNLVPGDTNGVGDVFVRDLLLGSTERVSVTSAGAQGDLSSQGPCSLSADGRFVAFSSFASNLVRLRIAGVHRGIYVHDRQTGITERVSYDTRPECSISADGRYVAFASSGPHGAQDVFLFDRSHGTATCISVDRFGRSWGGSSPAVSGDGRYVAFVSPAGVLAPDPNYVDDVFVRDTWTGRTERASAGAGIWQRYPASTMPSISADGRYVAFVSRAWDLVAGDTNWFVDVFVRDRQEGTTVRVSVDSSGAEGHGESVHPSISSDGRSVVFGGYAPDLVAGDTNGVPDIFVHDRGP